MNGVGGVALLASVLAAGACNSGGGTSSCLLAESAAGPGDAPATPVTCREWTGASDDVAARRADCASEAAAVAIIPLPATFSTEPCPQAGIEGGCLQTGDGVTYTDWYYSAEAPTAAYVVSICASVGGTYLPPP
jgi:hypothetical protein